MKSSFCLLLATSALCCAYVSRAQSTEEKKQEKKEISISNKGITVKKAPVDSATKAKNKEKEEKKKFSSNICMDLGWNFVQDNTDYTLASVKNALSGVPAGRQNKNLFELKQSKSVNVNLYWLQSFRALKTKGQRIYISSGLGFQIYNFRYINPVTYTRNPDGIALDSIGFSKNKLSVNYLNVPLMLTCKTRLYSNDADHKKDRWLVYGAGITGGYALSVWTKQKSDSRGKVKLHDDFGLSKFNSCISAEIGIDDVFRLYATYQLTNLYDNGMDQRPICIGFKLSGI